MRAVSVVLIALALAGCSTSGTSPSASSLPDPTPEPSATPIASPSPSADDSPSPAPTASASAERLEIGSFVETTADRLQLREEPGLDAESFGLLSVGSAGTVIEGPVDADGFTWYRLAWPGLPWGSGCATGPMDGGELIGCWGDGWIAGESADGDAWLRVAEPQCPEAPETVGDLAVVQPGVRLACFGDRELTVLGYITPEPGGRGCFPGYDITPAWLHICAISFLQGTEAEIEGMGPELDVNLHPNLGTCDFGGRTPDSCPFASYAGQWVEVVGHHDDAESANCTVSPEPGNTSAPDDALGRYLCRERFVVTSVQPGTGP